MRWNVGSVFVVVAVAVDVAIVSVAVSVVAALMRTFWTARPHQRVS